MTALKVPSLDLKIQYQNIKQHRAVQGGDDNPDYQQLLEMINDDSEHLAQHASTQPPADQ